MATFNFINVYEGKKNDQKTGEKRFIPLKSIVCGFKMREREQFD